MVVVSMNHAAGWWMDPVVVAERRVPMTMSVDLSHCPRTGQLHATVLVSGFASAHSLSTSSDLSCLYSCASVYPTYYSSAELALTACARSPVEMVTTAAIASHCSLSIPFHDTSRLGRDIRAATQKRFCVLDYCPGVHCVSLHSVSRS